VTQNHRTTCTQWIQHKVCLIIAQTHCVCALYSIALAFPVACLNIPMAMLGKHFMPLADLRRAPHVHAGRAAEGQGVLQAWRRRRGIEVVVPRYTILLQVSSKKSFFCHKILRNRVQTMCGDVVKGVVSLREMRKVGKRVHTTRKSPHQCRRWL
jgi:hypothetical protein